MTEDQVWDIEQIRQLLGLTEQRATESIYYALQAMQIAGQTVVEPAQDTTVTADTTGVDITTAILMDKYRK